MKLGYGGGMKPVSFWEILGLFLHIKKINMPTLKLMSSKLRAADRIGESVNTLVIGSSHARMGWIASEGEFNLGFGYQDLYYSYNLYRRYMDSPALKTVVVFFSVFSPGHRLIKTREARICVAFKAIGGIDWEDNVHADRLRLSWLYHLYRRKVRNYLDSHKYEDGDRGNEKKYTPFPATTAAERALGHLKNNCRDFDMTQYLWRIVEEAKIRNQRVCVVVPPVTVQYRAALPSAKVLFKSLEDIGTWKNAILLNHYDDDRFTDADFVDWDHLSVNGAKKLTKIVREEMFALQ